MLAIASAEDFHAAVATSASSGKALVACFSAPWCGGCKLVAPKVAELAAQLADAADFVGVSAEELEKLCEELEVDSYPHFRVYRDGKRAGDYTSSKFDKVDSFVRGLVAPDSLPDKAEETPEEEAAKPAELEEEGNSKKRQERDEEEASDEQAAKKAKTEEEEVSEAPKEEEAAADEAAEEADKTEETVEVVEDGADAEVADDEVVNEADKEAEKNEEEAAPVDKLQESEAEPAKADAAAA
ncbi:putative thioredoxin [Phytophthora cinnamomi]|uniref:putative thioredoxin n=1 Tax=Phytophthora cinnamomi TaxID=4785 RepID=UPI00355A01F2|nr:putative thioredoxin [Phytophthora cinnamomi]